MSRCWAIGTQRWVQKASSRYCHYPYTAALNVAISKEAPFVKDTTPKRRIKSLIGVRWGSRCSREAIRWWISRSRGISGAREDVVGLDRPIWMSNLGPQTYLVYESASVTRVVGQATQEAHGLFLVENPWATLGMFWIALDHNWLVTAKVYADGECVSEILGSSNANRWRESSKNIPIWICLRDVTLTARRNKPLREEHNGRYAKWSWTSKKGGREQPKSLGSKITW